MNEGQNISILINLHTFMIKNVYVRDRNLFQIFILIKLQDWLLFPRSWLLYSNIATWRLFITLNSGFSRCHFFLMYVYLACTLKMETGIAYFFFLNIFSMKGILLEEKNFISSHNPGNTDRMLTIKCVHAKFMKLQMRFRKFLLGDTCGPL